jgi:predicted esterase
LIPKWESHQAGISYESAGNGPPLVLIHGYGGDPTDFDGVKKILQHVFKVYVLKINGLFFSQEKPLHFSEQCDLVKSALKEIYEIGLNLTALGGPESTLLGIYNPCEFLRRKNRF